MIYKAYKIDRTINEEVICECFKVSNKKEMRKEVLSSPRLQEFTKIEYGRKTYSLSDIYAGR